MIKIGDYNELQVLRETSVGLYLGDNEGTEILLPNKYIPKVWELNQVLRVFCYLDHEERPVATTLIPSIIRDSFGFLEVIAINEIGAFLDWGLEKQLLVPFAEQQIRMVKGEKYVVFCYLDEKSFRLVASSRLKRFYDTTLPDYQQNNRVNLLVSRKTDLGWEVIIDGRYKGLLFHSDVFKTITLGDEIPGFIKKVRPDGKLDITLQPMGVKMLDGVSQLIYEKLEAANGFLALHDKTDPETIKIELGVSKKAFKKGVGVLYKQQKIDLLSNGIRLRPN